MERQRKIYIAKVAVIMGAIPFLVWAHSAGPPSGKSGVPGETTCNQAQCHVGTATNGGGGSVKFTLAGSSYTPGVKQHIVVTISDPTAKFWGFQATARPSADPRTQAGAFTSTDRFTAVVCNAPPFNETQDLFIDFPAAQNCPANKPLAYIEHTQNGSSRSASGSQTYEFDWTPPATNVGNITLYVAGNAANGNGQETGDHIYTASAELTPAAAGGGTPAITPGGVVSAGAFGGFTAVAPGSWMEIFGTNLSTTTRLWEGADFTGNKAPTSLDNVKVTIGGQLAFIDYISPTQVNAQVPSNTPVGAQQMTVSNPSGSSATYNITVNTLQPGLLAPSSFLVGGKQYVVAQFSDGSYVLPPNAIPGIASRQAKPGETIVIYGVGFGPVLDTGNQDIPAGTIVSTANKITNPMTMNFGAAAASLTYSGLAPNFVGLYQFNVVVPTVPDNDLVPLTFKLNGSSGSQTLFIAVHN